MLKQTAVNDCLSSATAGLNVQSMSSVRKTKREHYQANLSRASTGALQPEDVGLPIRGGNSRFSMTRSSKARSASRIAAKNRTGGGHVSMADQKYMTPMTAENQTAIL